VRRADSSAGGAPEGSLQPIAKAQGAESTLRRRTRPERVPLSFAQRRLWFVSQLDAANGAYNIPLTLRLKGVPDVSAMQAAANDLIERHEVLRTVFPEHDGMPHQLVLDPSDAHARIELIDTTEDALFAQTSASAVEPFNLAHETPLRIKLYRVAPDDHVLQIIVNHIAADGQSLPPLMRDMAMAYAARRADRALELPPLPVQYIDFTLWQQELLGSESEAGSAIHRQIEFWRNTLSSAPAEIDLPFDHAVPAVASYAGDSIPLRLPQPLHQRLVALARESQASLFMVLQAALATLLSRMGAGEDIPIGTPVAGRSDHVLDELIGCFVNTLVLRTDVSGEITFKQLVERVRGTNIAAYANQDVPFERLVEILNPPRSRARHALFQVMLALQNYGDGSALKMDDLAVSHYPIHASVARFDLALIVGEHRTPEGLPSGIEGYLEYRTDLFERSTAEALVARLVVLLETISEAPTLPLAQIEVLLPEERDELVSQWSMG